MKLLYAFMILILLSISAFGQEYMTSLTYTISVPNEDTQQFIDNTSFLGLSFDARKFVLPFWSIGIHLGWHVFYNKTDQLIELENGSVSGLQYRHVNSFPIMLNSHIFIGGEQCLRPYVGINAGAYYTWKRFEMGMILLEEKKWQWGVAPEAGFTIPLGDVHLNFSGKFNYAIKPGTSDVQKDPKSLMYTSFQVGIAYYR